MEWTDTALVLRVGRFRESDLWIRLLTRQRGVVSAFAFGASRSRRRFCGCLDLLNVIHVRAKDTRGGAYLNLEEGALLEGPRRLRSDWRRLGMFMNCMRFLEALGVAPDSGVSAFELTRALLAVLEHADDVRDALPVFFRLRMASDQGYVPDFSTCGECGAPMHEVASGWFQMASGNLTCPACALAEPDEPCEPEDDDAHCANAHAAYGGEQDLAPGPGRAAYGRSTDSTDGTALSSEVLAALRLVQQGTPEEWNALTLSPSAWRHCARLVDGFVQFHLGLSWENGRYRRQ